jgi:predicted ATP-grasp superfamily ATP-dependent carboligase
MPLGQPQRLLIVGASVRAAAFSALRAGWQPWCVDLFADGDLEQIGPAARVPPSDYPRGVVRLLDEGPPGPWMYTGALENRPALLSRLARTRPLWGNSGPTVRRVRRPQEVARCLAAAGLPCPRLGLADGEATGRWVVKPLASAGGAGINFWTRKDGPPPRGTYLQQFIEGEAVAAAYLGDGQAAALLGVTRQLVGEAWLYAAPFQYCGSIGPLALDAATVKAFADLGNALARDFGLRGLFGVDCVLQGCVPYPVEVNPRYTASIEVLEQATGLSALHLHGLAFTQGDRPGSWHGHPQQVAGKVYLYAQDDLVVPAQGPWLETLDQPATGWRDFADIPHEGERIECGQPIMTLLARAGSDSSCQALLRERAEALDRWLFAR